MSQKGLLLTLKQALRCLPGVGSKTAQRMMFHLLQRDREGARHLATAILSALEGVGYCEECRTLSEHRRCTLCADSTRDRSLLCVVETPAEAIAIEQATSFKGLFFVLNGRLSPLDGIGPEALHLDILEKRLHSSELKEVVLATNATVEGEATAHYIHTMASRYRVHTTRMAYGIPMGGELEYLDSITLAYAFQGRREV